MGSAWDQKPFGKSQEPLVNLRYSVAVARIEYHKSYPQIREQFGVSDGFIAKWSKVYAAHKTLVRTSYSWPKDQILMRFSSISNRPKNVSRPVQDRIRRDILDRRRKYGFEPLIS